MASHWALLRKMRPRCPPPPPPPIYETNQSHQIGLKPTSIERALKADHFSYKDLGIILIGSKVIALQILDDITSAQNVYLKMYSTKQLKKLCNDYFYDRKFENRLFSLML